MVIRMRSRLGRWLGIGLASVSGWAVAQPVLPLPPRATNALDGAQLAAELRNLSLPEREERIFKEIINGNVPDSLRTLHGVPWVIPGETSNRTATMWVTADYLSVGHTTNFLRVPLSPITAQRLADALDASLPTARLVDAIWQAADVRLNPEPMPPGSGMIQVPAFWEHQERIEQQRAGRMGLIAGHKKDVVLFPQLSEGNVAIYGWHRTNGQPIQPLFQRHVATWVDYSHGIRLISREATVTDQTVPLSEVLPALSRYPTNWPAEFAPQTSLKLASPAQTPVIPPQPVPPPQLASSAFGELETEFRLEPEVRVRLNLPAATNTQRDLLVLFALPNGNTIEQTMGRRPQNTNEARYDYQHIAAQMRFVRAAMPDVRLGIAYLEARGLSWPAWRKRNGNSAIPRLVESVRSAYSTNQSDFILTGHSGGGSFMFGYLYAVTNLPPQLHQLAFLDANYAYETDAHRDKLIHWLQANPTARLDVLAYHDAAALLNGKSFISEAGGTWGRSQLMLQDLQTTFNFQNTTNGPMRTHRAANGRIEFLLRENPERKVWHTVLVQRNGLIHVLLADTPAAGQGYEYLGPQAYERFISDEAK